MWTIYGHELVLAGIVAVIMVAGVIAIVWRDRRFDPEHSTQVVLSDDERTILLGAAGAKTQQIALARKSVKKKARQARRGREPQPAESREPGSES